MFFNTHPDYTQEKNLARHVSTRNQVNVMANELRLHFKDILKPYIGKKVVKVTPYKYWLKSIEPKTRNLQNWMHEQGFRLTFTFCNSCIFANLDKTYKVSEQRVDFVKQEFTIALIRDCILEDCEKFICDKFRIDYTSEEITETRKQISDLESQISQLKSNIREFTY